MEVVAIEGVLTDFEVQQLITSPIYEKYDTLQRHEHDRKFLLTRQKFLEQRLRPHEQRLQSFQSQFQQGIIQENDFQTSCQNELNKSQQINRELSSVRSQLLFNNKTVSTIWMLDHIKKYLKFLPCYTQTEDNIAQFMLSINQFMVQHNVIITQGELIMLINLRPQSETILNLVLSGMFDRMPSIETRSELLQLITTHLPPPPPLPSEEPQNEKKNDKKKNQHDDDEEEEIYEDEVYEISDVEDNTATMHEEICDFDNSYDQQHDQDDNNGGGDDD